MTAPDTTYSPQDTPQRAEPSVIPRYLTGFKSLPPRYSTPQKELLDWLAAAHARASGQALSTVRALFERYSASAEDIALRGHELEDFTHQDTSRMTLFGDRTTDLLAKTHFFDAQVGKVFEKLYPIGAVPPSAIVHVTCTGYRSPSGAQRLVSIRDWGRQTEVLHAYHMGCYAAHPAIRMASGLTAAHSIDVVHTELCTLHLDLSQQDPAQLVIQSLFADGFIQYSVSREKPTAEGFEILAAKDEIIPNSAQAMVWETGPFHFMMELSREVPVLLASTLPRFVSDLSTAAGYDWMSEKQNMLFAIHPGGPRIIELSQKILGARPDQVRHSKQVLLEQGNMSSATLPHIWKRILEDPTVTNGTPVISLGAGPGLTLSGMVFVKRDVA